MLPDGDSVASGSSVAADIGNCAKSLNRNAGGVDLVGVDCVEEELVVGGRRSRSPNRFGPDGSCQIGYVPKQHLEVQY